ALDELGMVMDFGDVKAVVKRWIDENLDHRMILHRDDPAVEFLKQQNEPMFLIDTNPTAESIAALIFNFATDQGLPVSEVRLWETASSYASCRE
ncbi:MAG: 6-carboxytetrahydropterin synthase, partial [Planctomycetota bacterium]|nr:6-carboxytetrahydropterin synthase [Planctomycetota bacterium]